MEHSGTAVLDSRKSLRGRPAAVQQSWSTSSHPEQTSGALRARDHRSPFRLQGRQEYGTAAVLWQCLAMMSSPRQCGILGLRFLELWPPKWTARFEVNSNGWED